MTRTNHMPRRLLATALAVLLAYGSTPAQIAQATEPDLAATLEDLATTVATQSDETAAENAATTDAELVSEPSTGDAVAESDRPQPTADTQADPAAPLAATTDDSSTDAADQQPYTITVSVDGIELSGETTDLGTWGDGAKTLTVELKRNKTVAVDSSKTYVLAMSVPDVLYFNGVPEAAGITGVEEVYFKRNAIPQVVTNANAPSNYSKFSAYSGEIRMRLNTLTDQVTISNLGFSFDPQLAGYRTTSNLSNALDIKVTEVSSSDIDYDDSSSAARLLLERKISATISNSRESTKPGTVRLFLSNDGFVQDTVTIGKAVEISKKGSISYALGPNGMTTQLYKKLVIVFHCPYVKLSGDDTPYYLEFSDNDQAIVSNKQGTKSGFYMSSQAVVNKTDHTITYTFENVLPSEWAILLYTPQFYWPSELNEQKDDGSSYEIYGSTWSVDDQTSYLGGQSTLFSDNGELTPNGTAKFVPDAVDVKLQSSHVGEKLTYFTPYEGLSSDSSTGALGFFDLHNEGVAAAPKVKIEFEFNTDTSPNAARYHITNVNLPVDGNTDGTTVDFVLSTDSGVEAEGTATFATVSNNYVACTIAKLKSVANVSGAYYIKKLSYTSEKLSGGKVYHTEVVDAYHGRYRTSEPGLFSGWMSGEVGQSASAKMTVSSLDGTSITKDEASSLTTTEVSQISNDNSIASALRDLTVDGQKSSSINAGQSVSLNLSFTMQTDIYSLYDGLVWNQRGAINGYRVLEKPALYICLPEGVSIAGSEQAQLKTSNQTKQATQASAIEGSDCLVGSTKAKWWKVEFDGVSVADTGYAYAQLQLSTDRLMSSVTWDFDSAVVLRARGQHVKSNDSTTSFRVNKVSDLASNSSNAIKALGTALTNDQDNEHLGLVFWKNAEARTLNISRAEAKLDVDTKLSLEGSAAASGESLKLTDENGTLDYDVTVSSNDGGSASDFSYYIPIAKAGTALDSSAFVSKSDYSLKLKDAVTITDSNKNNTALTRIPFEVYYTTQANLTSSTITGDNISWLTGDKLTNGFSEVTAVKIVTTTDDADKPSTIWEGSTFKFELKLAYDNSNSDFASNAGREVAWRTFGHYTYIASSGAETTNTYPSGTNSIKLGYVSDRTAEPIIVTLDASKGTSSSADFDFKQTFATSKTFKIKKVTPFNVDLTNEDPTNFPGSKANSNFRVTFALDRAGQGHYLNTSATPTFDAIAVGINLKATVSVAFSSALSETAEERYVDVLLGDDDVDITVRIKLIRRYTPAAATNAGVAAGEQYLVPNVLGNSVSVANNSAFTAVFPVTDFTPTNYSARKLKWKDSAGKASSIPAGTTITMVELKKDGTPDSYYLWTSEGDKGEVNLNEFKHMGSNKSFSYDTESTTSVSFTYLFVVNFAGANAPTDSYKIAFGADNVSDAAAFDDADESVTLADPGTYTLKADSNTLSYEVGVSAADDESYRSGKTLSLVLKPASGVTLPADAKLKAGDDTYEQNSKGEFIVPLNGSTASGSKTFSIVSSQLPASGATYALEASLVLVGSTEGASPYAGEQVADSVEITLTADKHDTASLSVGGKRVATVAEWKTGQDIALNVQIPEGTSLTVSAYQSLTGTAQVTDLLSSVNGQFDFSNGVGTYDSTKQSTEQLVLSSAARAGTYRLVFDVKDAAGALIESVPYVIIVRD